MTTENSVQMALPERHSMTIENNILTNCLFNLLKVTSQKDTKVIYVKFLYLTSSLNTNYTRCTQREQNARLHVTSLSSDIKYCKEDNKIKPNM